MGTMELCRNIIKVIIAISSWLFSIYNVFMAFYSHMIEDLRMLSDKIEGIEKNSSMVVRQKQMQVLDLERNILQVRDF